MRTGAPIEDIAALAAPSLVALEGEGGRGMGFVVSEGGLVVTTLHVALTTAATEVRYADGRVRRIHAVSGIDPKRDIAVLRTDARDTPILPIGPERLLEVGARVFIVADEKTTIERRVATVQPMGEGFTLYIFGGGLVPEEASGAPIVDHTGALLAMAARARGPSGVLSVGVPRRNLDPVISANERIPMALLRKLAKKKPIERRVPQHPVSMLGGCDPAHLEAIRTAIAGAIEEGAPAYNNGDIATCYQVYTACAQRLIAEHEDCPGPQRALGDGLAKAEALTDPDAQAWVMRDTLDGMLSVIERWLALPPESRPSTPSSPPRALN
jgi:serine protease Do